MEDPWKVHGGFNDSCAARRSMGHAHHWTIPDDGLGREDLRRVELDRLGATVEAHEPIGHLIKSMG